MRPPWSWEQTLGTSARCCLLMFGNTIRGIRCPALAAELDLTARLLAISPRRTWLISLMAHRLGNLTTQRFATEVHELSFDQAVANETRRQEEAAARKKKQKSTSTVPVDGVEITAQGDGANEQRTRRSKRGSRGKSRIRILPAESSDSANSEDSCSSCGRHWHDIARSLSKPHM